MSGSGEIICCSTPVLLKPSCSRSMANRGRRTVAGTLTHRFAIARLAVPLAVAMPHHLERSQIATAWSHSGGGGGMYKYLCRAARAFQMENILLEDSGYERGLG